jgi:hypothetical protein
MDIGALIGRNAAPSTETTTAPTIAASGADGAPTLDFASLLLGEPATAAPPAAVQGKINEIPLKGLETLAFSDVVNTATVDDPLVPASPATAGTLTQIGEAVAAPPEVTPRNDAAPVAEDAAAPVKSADAKPALPIRGESVPGAAMPPPDAPRAVSGRNEAAPAGPMKTVGASTPAPTSSDGADREAAATDVPARIPAGDATAAAIPAPQTAAPRSEATRAQRDDDDGVGESPDVLPLAAAPSAPVPARGAPTPDAAPRTVAKSLRETSSEAVPDRSRAARDPTISADAMAPAAAQGAPAAMPVAQPVAGQFAQPAARPASPADNIDTPDIEMAATDGSSRTRDLAFNLAAQVRDAAPRQDPPGMHAARAVADAISLGRDRDRVELRLDPPELGRVAIDLKHHDGVLTASVAADRPDTLDLLRRHADTLQRELAASGFGRADISFSDRHPDGNRHDSPAPADFAMAREDAKPTAAPRAYGTRITLNDRLDIRL